MSEKLYAERDIEEQGEYYFRHASAMTGEDLHSKSDIAAELAHRDIEIDTLRQQLDQAQTECYEALRRVAEIKRHADRMLAAIQADDFALDQEAQFNADALSFNATEDYLIWLEDQRLRQQAEDLENQQEK